MDEQKIKKIYERLTTFSIDLPRDSASMGPDFLREAISVCRNYLNETAHYLQDALVGESSLLARLEAEQATFQVRSTELLATNSAVAERSSIADRMAVVDNILRQEKQSITALQSELRILGHVKTVIRNRQTELNNTMGSIRLQRSLLKDALRTGAFYGDESNDSRGHGGLDPVDSLNTVDLEALVATSEAELEAEALLRPVSLPVNDPADSLDSEALEAITQQEADPDDDQLDAELRRFLAEPDEDVASLIAAV